ncbi:MAG: hypothetical protein QM666_06695 [Acinetobacter sp.]
MRVVVSSFFGLCLLSSSVWAVETATQPTATTVAPSVVTPKPTNTTQTPTTTNQGKGNNPPSLVEMTPAQIAKNKAEEDAKIKAMVKSQTTRMQQLEQANLEALAQNQELQLKNDNLGVQVQVLQSERSAQLFMYGAATLGIGVLIGFFIAGYVYTKRRRQW